MPDAPHFAPEPTLADRALALGEQHLAMLGRLAEMGMNLAAEVERQALAQAAPVAETALAYSRVARAVRLTLALQAKVMQDMTAPPDEAEPWGGGAPEDEATPGLGPRADAVERVVYKAVMAEHWRDGETLMRMRDAIWERLWDDDINDLLLERPIGETVAIICKDLGLTPDWSRWAQEPWAIEEAGQPGSPFPARDRAPADEPDMRLEPQAASP